jgi:hypothetical protein
VRITIGHLLILFLLGGGATVGVVNSSKSGLGGKFDAGIAAVKGLFKSGEVEEKIPAQALPADSPLISTAPEAAPKPASDDSANVVPATPETEDPRTKIPDGALTIDETIGDPEPEPEAAVVEKKAETPPTPKKVRRKKVAAPKAAAAAPTAQAAPRKKRAAKVSADSLIGTYVTLTLKSGREVKGVLENKTPTAYMIQLPGMGPFEYKASDVAGVKAVE